MTLPEALSPDAISELLARLGYVVDRRNLVLALQSEPIPGVTPSPCRGTPWSIAPSALLDVVAAVLRRRAMRAASRSFQPVPPLARYHRAAGEIMLRDPDLAPLVPKQLRLSIEAAAQLRREAAEARRQAAAWAAGREQRMAEHREREDGRRLHEFGRLHLYFEARLRVTAARFPKLDKEAIESPAYTSFCVEWPFPNAIPPSWLPPPGTLDAAAELLRPWMLGTAKAPPELRHLLPSEIDWSQPWPWWRDDA
jgi:hypothetical protein